MTVITLLLTIPVTAASAERSFSKLQLQNKTILEAQWGKKD
jgi:hypothetical protein